jgi:hypothetical protein
MRYTGITVLIAGLLVSTAALASDADAEQALVEAIVSDDDVVVSKPTMVVKVGQHAEINASGAEGASARVGLQVRVDREGAERRKVSVVGLLAGTKVVEGELRFTKDRDATTTLSGGGLTWKIRVARMTPELVERRRKDPTSDKQP